VPQGATAGAAVSANMAPPVVLSPKMSKRHPVGRGTAQHATQCKRMNLNILKKQRCERVLREDPVLRRNREVGWRAQILKRMLARRHALRHVGESRTLGVCTGAVVAAARHCQSAHRSV